MKRIIIALTLSLICALYTPSSAQDIDRNVPQFVTYMEILGQGGLVTFNYDRRFTNSADGPGFRVGLGYVNLGQFQGYTFPVGLNYLQGKNGKYFELGIGATYGKIGIIDRFDNEARLTGNMFFGFRYQPEDRGLNIRAGLATLVGNIKEPEQENEAFFIPLPGISFGYTFR